VKRFKSLKPLLEMDRTKPTFEKVQEVADAVGKHPATIYRWLEAYDRSSHGGPDTISNRTHKPIWKLHGEFFPNPRATAV
jgi:hypothetical protein